MDIKVLKPSSAKLLLHLLVNGGSAEHLSSLAELLDMDRKTLAQARKQLEEAHLIGEYFPKTIERVAFAVRNYSPVTLSVGEIFHTPGENLPTPAGNNSPPGENLPKGEENLPSNPRTRCAEADRSHDRTTQLKALSFAFSVRFPGHDIPSVESLKRLLQMTGNSAETVDDAFERASARKPDSPFSYVRKMLEGSPPVAIGPTRQAAQPPEDDLQPVPEELRAKWKADSEKMRRLGILPADGGDTWE